MYGGIAKASFITSIRISIALAADQASNREKWAGLINNKDIIFHQDIARPHMHIFTYSADIEY